MKKQQITSNVFLKKCNHWDSNLLFKEFVWWNVYNCYLLCYAFVYTFWYFTSIKSDTGVYTNEKGQNALP